MAKAKSSLADAEKQAAALVGEQATKTPDKKGQVKPKVGEPFYSYGKQVYKTREELDKAMEDSFMMQSRFTQKTQDLSARQKEYDKKELDLRFREENAKRLENDYKRYSDFISSPQGQRIYPELERYMNQGVNPSDYKAQILEAVKEELGPQLQELNDFKRDQQAMKAKEDAYNSLAEKYGDKFDRDGVQKYMDELMEGDMSVLYEMAHHAHLGRSATQEQVTTDQPSGATAADTIPSGGGVAAVSTPETTPSTTEEALHLANADLGITEEDYD
jgi:hypothetical protein